MTDPSTLLLMGGVALVIGAVFVFLAWFARLGRLRPETSRKAAHIAVGLCAVSFGWLFDETGPVVVLSAGGLAFALAVRFVPFLHRAMGAVVHGVSRRSFGDSCFPIVVPILHWLAMPEREFYVIPMLVLTLADSAAALVGKRIGRWAYRTDEGLKTLEGSAALAVVTAAVVLGSLLLWGYEFPRATSIAVLMSILVMLAEAISWRGLDNLVLPLGSFALLRIYAELPEEMILIRVAVAVLLTLFAVLWHRKAGLIGAAGMASAFTVYACWAIGGGVWAVPPLLILVCLPFLGARHIDARDDDLGVGVVLSMSAAPLAWLFLHETVALHSTLTPYLAAWAGVLGVIWIVRWNRDRAMGAPDPSLLFKVLALVVLLCATAWIAPGETRDRLSIVLPAIGAFALAAIIEQIANLDTRTISDEARWAIRMAMVLVSSLVGFAPGIFSTGDGL